MTINFNRPGNPQLSGGHISKTPDAGNRPASAKNTDTSDVGTAARDSVQLSSNALQMQNLAEQLASSPDIADSAKVAQIREAIADGSYNVDSRQVADKMLDFEARFN